MRKKLGFKKNLTCVLKLKLDVMLISSYRIKGLGALKD